nr:MAG TPA: hypothetical protein [Caudoviricetes sp.]
MLCHSVANLGPCVSLLINTVAMFFHSVLFLSFAVPVHCSAF